MFIKNFTIHHYQFIPSTNSLALEQIKNHTIDHNHVIIADSQDGGRGRMGRSWVSPVGNLYFSLVVKSPKSITQNGELSFVASLAMMEAISSFNLASDIKLKWPNDILINGYKASGILLESDGEFVVIGIGVNLNSHPDNTTYPATDLKNEGFEALDKFKLLEKFLHNFEILYQKWCDFGFEPIRNLWIKNAFNLNKEINVNLPDKSLKGIFKDLDKNGNLVLNSDNKNILISSGEIFL